MVIKAYHQYVIQYEKSLLLLQLSSNLQIRYTTSYITMGLSVGTLKQLTINAFTQLRWE